MTHNIVRNLKRDVKGIAYENYIHGFIGMDNVKEFNQIITDASIMIEQLVNL